MASEPAPQPSAKKLTLSPSIVTPSDVGRLLRELETVENAILQHKTRGTKSQLALPATSHRMEGLVEHNQLNLLQPDDRQSLNAFLLGIKTRAPLLHISFSAEPTPAFLEKLTVWLRREIHPYVLFSVGLQPAIGAGCVVRTTNKYFDLSLRQTFVQKRPLLLAQIIPPGPEVLPG